MKRSKYEKDGGHAERNLRRLGARKLAPSSLFEPKGLIGAAQLIMCFGHFGIGSNCTFELPGGIVRPLEIEVEFAQRFVRLRVVGQNFHRPAECCDGISGPLLPAVNDPEIIGGGKIAGVDFERALEGSFGSVDVAGTKLRNPQVISC